MATLDKVDPRNRLKLRREPYWQRLSEGRYLGFRRMTAGSEGTWLARYYDGARNHQLALGTLDSLDPGRRYDSAKKAAEDFFKQQDQGGSAKPGTVADACAAYVTYLRSENRSTAADDAEARLQRLVHADPIARVDLSKLAPHHVSDWRTRLRPKGSDASFNRNATFLRAALNHAKEQGRIVSDLAWKTALKPIKDAGTPRTLYLKLEKRRAMIEAASDEARPFLEALALLPMRPGELASLKVAHLDVERGLLRIPKGKTKAREVPLGGDALAHLKACARSKMPTAWLLSRANGGQWKKEAWRDEVKEAAKAAKLPAATVALTLRHSTITDLVTIAKLDLFTVARLAGTSVVMIEKTYGKLQADSARAALQGLSLRAAS